MAKIKINRRKDYKEQLKLYLNLSKSLNAKVKKLLRKTSRKAEQEYLKFNDMYYFFLEDFSNDLYKILSSHYRSVITTTSERLIKQRETKQEEEIDIIVATYIADVTANKVADISQTTRKQIKQAIKVGIADGLSIPEISEKIRRNRSFAPYRATMIARTETIRASNIGAMSGAKMTGLKLNKEWISTFDDRTRDDHLAADGQIVGRDEFFNVGPDQLQYPADASGSAWNTINCRCTLAFIPK